VRNRLIKVLTSAFVVFVTVIFALFFGQRGGHGAGDVAEVDGKRIRRDVFEVFREQNERALQGLIQGLSRNDQRRFVDNQTLDGLIRRSILTDEAAKLGLGVTDAELAESLHSDPQFQKDGRFERKLVEGLAAGVHLSVGELLDQMRVDTELRKFQRFATSPVRVSRAAARFELQRRGAERSLKSAIARTGDFQARVALDPAAPKALVEKDPARVQAVYDARRAEFQQPEQVRAKHILFAGEDGEARAAAVAKRLAAGESFDKLARELSEDAATASQGGDLGWFPRGIMAKEIDAVAFDQLEPGKVSAPLKTDRGWHLVLLEEKRPAQDRSFADVAESLAREILLEEQASQMARDAAARVLEAARASGDLAAAAAKEGLSVETSALFKRSDSSVPGMGAIQGLIEVAFALDPSHPVAPQVYQDGAQYYAIALGEVHEPDAASIDGQLTAEAERLTSEERDRTSALWYAERRRALQDGGDLKLFPLYERE
jgi:peptidyl-prolyl cis-trans isomerase D